jgi:hypothetical protein
MSCPMIHLPSSLSSYSDLFMCSPSYICIDSTSPPSLLLYHLTLTSYLSSYQHINLTPQSSLLPYHITLTSLPVLLLTYKADPSIFPPSLSSYSYLLTCPPTYKYIWPLNLPSFFILLLWPHYLSSTVLTYKSYPSIFPPSLSSYSDILTCSSSVLIIWTLTSPPSLYSWDDLCMFPLLCFLTLISMLSLLTYPAPLTSPHFPSLSSSSDLSTFPFLILFLWPLHIPLT